MQVQTHPGESLKAQMVTFHRLNAVISGKPAIAIHNECNMLGHWPLAQGTNK